MTKPPTFEEKVVAHFQSCIEIALENTPELHQVAVVFDWSRGLNMGAIPFIVGPQLPQQLGDLHGMLEQQAKLVTHLSKQLEQAVQRYQHYCAQLEEQRNEALAKEGDGQEGSQQGESQTSGEQEPGLSHHGDGSGFD